jgi:hypothetical protein
MSDRSRESDRQLDRADEATDPTVASRSDGVGTRSNRIPSAEELASIAAALRSLLKTFEQYKLFLDDPSGPIGDGVPTIAMLATDALCRTEMQGSFCRLERLLNPRRLPYGSPELASIVVRGWPPQVMTGLSVLNHHVDQLIRRWDIPEVCDNRTMMRGRYGITRDDGTVEEIDRPVQRCTLTTSDRDQLRWVLNAFVEALGEAIEARSPAAIPEEEGRPAAAPAFGTMPPPPSGAMTDRYQDDESQKMVKDQVFISYSHQDKRFLDDLKKHLKPYLRKGTITAWSDEQIEPGSRWFDEIKAALAKTSVAVILVSPDFLDSDFIHEHELGPFLKEAEAGGVKILWILIRDCAWKETPLKDYQAVVSPPDRPLASMTKANRDTAWRRVCEEIKRAASQALNGSPDSTGPSPVSQREAVSIGPKPQTKSAATLLYEPAIEGTTKGANVAQSSKVICPLHGIRTLAAWQRGLSDLLGRHGWVCRLDRWSYGRFSLWAFLTPWTREAKLNWLRRQYDAEMHDRRLDIERGQPPSVVAHSFGTYILGYTLLRFDFIRFNKVILCGSILPVDFPWDKLIERGQVQAVRNEYGVRDPWVRRVRCFVRGTGPSGASGFTCQHERLEQEEFEYDHGDYFGLDHMEDRWLPFLNRPLAEIPRAEAGPRIPRPKTAPPWCLYAVVLALVLLVGAVVAYVTWVPAARLDGHVTDENGDALAGVELVIQDRLNRNGSKPKAITEGDGAYHFDNLRPAGPTDPQFPEVRLMVTKLGYQTKRTDAPLGAPDHPIKLKRLAPSEDRP